MSLLKEKLKKYIQNNLNVLLIGNHGIGKTSLIKEIAKELNLNLKYYSSSLLDPFVDLSGIPVPDLQNKTLEFFRTKDLENAEFLMFDEINRAHPRILNAIFEIIQFKTINGVRLPNLKSVCAAMNPPGKNYQVEELDPALVDRFHCYVKISAHIDLEYLKTVINEPIAVALKTWWDTILDDKQKEILSPRRLEYIGLMIDKNLSFRDALPQGHEFPISFLESKISKIKNNIVDEKELDPTKENILKNPLYFKDRIKLDPTLITNFTETIKHFDKLDILKTKDLLESFPKDLLDNIFSRKLPGLRRQILNLFISEKMTVEKYPKLFTTFGYFNEKNE